MVDQDNARLHQFVKKLASSRPAAWFLARSLHHFDRIVLKLSGGKTTMSSILAGVPIVNVETKGARSGRPRPIPLICIRDSSNPDSFALIASNYGQRRNPAWYYNLKANPRAQCLIEGESEEYEAYIAHEASGEEYDQFWQAAVDAYGGYALYEQRAANRRIPIMVMIPANE